MCNDIVISKSLDSGKSKFNLLENKTKKFVIEEKPSLLFEDFEGLFPIKLDRNDIDCNILPFEKELYKEVAKNFIAYILNLEINVDKEIKNIKLSWSVNASTAILFSKNGYTFNIDYFYDKVQKNNSFLVRVLRDKGSINSNILKFDDLVFYFEHDNHMALSSSEGYVAPKCGGTIILKLTDYKKFFTYEKNRISASARSNHEVKYQNEKFIIYTVYNVDNTPILISQNNLNIIEQLDSKISSIQEVPYSFLKLDGKYLESGEILHDLLTKYIGDEVIIPYDLEERKNNYPKAFEELAVYMDKLQYDQ